MAYYLLSLLTVVLFITTIAASAYARKVYKRLKDNETEIHSLNLALGYAEMGLDLSNDKIQVMKSEIHRLNSENKLLNAKITKINNQFKNVKNYLKDN